MILPQSNRLLLASVCLSILWTASVTFASNTKLPVSACSKIFGGGIQAAPLFAKTIQTGSNGGFQVQDIKFISEVLKPGSDVEANLGEIKNIIQQINQVVGQNLSIPSQISVRTSADAKGSSVLVGGEITFPLNLLRSPSFQSFFGVIAHEYGHVLLHHLFRTKRSSLSWIFNGRDKWADLGDSDFKAMRTKSNEIVEAMDRAEGDEVKRLIALNEEHHNSSKDVLARYHKQKKIANRFYNEILHAYDEFFADVIAVSVFNDPRVISQSLTAIEGLGEHAELRDFTSTIAIPDKFKERRPSPINFALPMRDSYFHLTPARRAVWKKYLSQPGIDQGKIISAVVEAIISETAKIYENWLNTDSLPSVVEMNSRLIDEIDQKLTSKAP